MIVSTKVDERSVNEKQDPEIYRKSCQVEKKKKKPSLGSFFHVEKFQIFQSSSPDPEEELRIDCFFVQIAVAERALLEA